MNRVPKPNPQNDLASRPPVASEEDCLTALQKITERGITGTDTENRGASPCLTEEECLTYTLHPEDNPKRGLWEEHLAQCPLCTAEIARLHHLADLWDQSATAARMEIRLAMSSPRLLDALRHRSTSLSALVRPSGAFGDAPENEEVAIHFAVSAPDGNLTGLHGTLIRHNTEYYVQIPARFPASLAFEKGVRIFLTLIDPALPKPLLQRQVEVGVTTILGTDLRLTEACFVQACLLPANA